MNLKVVLLLTICLSIPSEALSRTATIDQTNDPGARVEGSIPSPNNMAKPQRTRIFYAIADIPEGEELCPERIRTRLIDDQKKDNMPNYANAVTSVEQLNHRFAVADIPMGSIIYLSNLKPAGYEPPIDQTLTVHLTAGELQVLKDYVSILRLHLTPEDVARMCIRKLATERDNSILLGSDWSKIMPSESPSEMPSDSPTGSASQ